MKKGFTLVEMAVVLVIIGLIMGMAIKGKELIDVANMTAEVNKIRKVQTVVAIMEAKGRKVPIHPTNNPNLGDWRVFLDYGITTNDLKFKYANSSFSSYRNDNFGFDVNILLYGTQKMPVVGGFWINYMPFAYKEIPEYGFYIRPYPKFMCNIERILDDADPLRGIGIFASTLFGENAAVVTASNNFTDCSGLRNAPYSSGDTGFYSEISYSIILGTNK